jgi:hypothetical protein
MKTLTLCIALAVMFSFSAPADFEGSITYRYTKYDSTGMPGYFPQELETMHVSSSEILFQIISGHVKYALGYDLLLDIDKHRRCEVYRESKKLFVLPAEKVDSCYFTVLESGTGQSVLGYKCTIRTLKHFDMHSKDTVQRIYYLNDTFRKSGMKQFAALQGNKSTLFLDGRFGTIPLKVEILYSTSKERIVIEAVDVKQQSSKEVFMLSDFEIQKSR